MVALSESVLYSSHAASSISFVAFAFSVAIGTVGEIGVDVLVGLGVRVGEEVGEGVNAKIVVIISACAVSVALMILAVSVCFSSIAKVETCVGVSFGAGV